MKFLCSLAELENKPSKGFELSETESIFLVKKADEVFGYENHCPHLGVNLEWKEDQFLDSTETLIQCAMHGALFSIDTGLCVSGPCRGQSLNKVNLHHDENNRIFALEEVNPKEQE